MYPITADEKHRIAAKVVASIANYSPTLSSLPAQFCLVGFALWKPTRKSSTSMAFRGEGGAKADSISALNIGKVPISDPSALGLSMLIDPLQGHSQVVFGPPQHCGFFYLPRPPLVHHFRSSFLCVASQTMHETFPLFSFLFC
jgi:hypothetical protein